MFNVKKNIRILAVAARMEIIFQENILLSILSIIQTEICIYVVQQNIAQMQITHSRNKIFQKKMQGPFLF